MKLWLIALCLLFPIAASALTPEYYNDLILSKSTVVVIGYRKNAPKSYTFRNANYSQSRRIHLVS